MPKKTDSLYNDLYRLLKVQGFDPMPKDEKGNNVPVPDEAEVIKFTYKQNDKPIDSAWLTINNGTLSVYYDDNIMKQGTVSEDEGMESPESFTDFLKNLKNWSQRRQLDFDLENKDHLQNDMAKRAYVKEQEKIAESKQKGKIMNKDKSNIAEGYYAMGKSASYNDAIPTVKIVIQHTRQIQEDEQRFRNIARIYLENAQGERILAPTIRPGIAQIYARHLAEGGLPHDERWKHLTSLVEEYTKMAGFVRATRNKVFTESAQKLINEGINHYYALRESLGKMRGHRGYNMYFESWTPALMETENEENRLDELFVQETLDPRIESVMPILSRLHKKVNEMAETTELEEWADGVISEKLELTDVGEATDPKSIPENETASSDNTVKEELRLLGKKESDTRLAKIYKDNEWDEFRVKFYIDGKYQGEESDYHTDDKTDAIQTAEHWCKDENKQGVVEAQYDRSVDIGKQMANDGITYSPEREKELIGKMAEYMKRSGFSSREIRYLMNYDEDYVADQLGYLPREKGLAEGEFAGNYATGKEGQWRNKGPKKDQPAKVGDLVGASESIDPLVQLKKLLGK